MKFQRRFSVVERNDIVEKSQQCLWAEEGKAGLEYLVVNRSLSKDVIKQFGLGYIPPKVNHQLAGRIVIPIYDPSKNL